MTAALANHGLRKKLDALERAVIVCLYLFLLYRFAGAVAENPLNAVYLVTEGIVMLLVLCRRSTEQISASARDWAVAFAGTFASMMLMLGHEIQHAHFLAEFFLYFGLSISLFAKLQLRRSFGIVAANRGVKTSGVYAVVRHPMYLGYFFVQGGMLLINFSLWNAGVIALWAVMQIQRVQAEEAVLAQDPAYSAHMKRVNYRLVPYLY